MLNLDHQRVALSIAILNSNLRVVLLSQPYRTLFLVKRFLTKPTELSKHVHFRLPSDNPIHMKSSSSFLEFDFASTNVLGFNLSDKLLYQLAVPMSTEEEAQPSDTYSSSDAQLNEILYGTATQFTDEEWEVKMNTNEPPTSIPQIPKHRCTGWPA